MKRVVVLALSIFLLLFLASSSLANEMMLASASYNEKELENGSLIVVDPNSDNMGILFQINTFIQDEGNTSVSLNLAKLVLYYSWDNAPCEVAAEGIESVAITIPDVFEPGSMHLLQMEGVINDADNGYVGNSNIITLSVMIASNEPTLVFPHLIIPEATFVTVKKWHSFILIADTTIPAGIKSLAYQWDNGELLVVDGDIAVIYIPSNFELGSYHTLRVLAEAYDETLSEMQIYRVKIDTTQ